MSISILVENLPDLVVMLEWFIHPNRQPAFIPLRTKDRISRRRSSPTPRRLSGYTSTPPPLPFRAQLAS